MSRPVALGAWRCWELPTATGAPLAGVRLHASTRERASKTRLELRCECWCLSVSAWRSLPGSDRWCACGEDERGDLEAKE